MSSLAQVIQQIRFSLDELSTQNGHHEFEHLCRHFARLRISRFVIPASGPVASGGDQARDFETFISFLGRELHRPATPWMGAEDAGKRIAFGCTLQKENHTTKIRTDINTIGTSVPKTDFVYYFLGSSMPVSARHKLQTWAMETHTIELEIIDSEALSEQLSEHDLFWIAEEYLKIPSEIYPVNPSQKNNYDERKEYWERAALTFTKNYAEFTEARALAGHALKNVPSDIPFWLSIMDHFIKQTENSRLQRKALYEYLAIYAGHKQTYEGQKYRLFEYMDTPSAIDSIEMAEDLLVIFMYAATFHSTNIFKIDSKKIDEWADKLVQFVQKRIKTDQSKTQYCYALQLQGKLDIITPILTGGDRNIDQAFERWIELAELVEDCPTYPLSSFSKFLTTSIPYIGGHPKFDYLCARVDEVIARRTGSAHAADSCRDRALAFYESGEVLRAMDQIHKAKIGWFNDEAIEGSAIACHTLAKIYGGLGLNYAAKYYSLTEAAVSLHSSAEAFHDRVPQALAQAASFDFAQGQWFSACGLILCMRATHFEFSQNPLDMEQHNFFLEALQMLLIGDGLTKRFFPTINPFFEEFFQKLALGEEFDEIRELAHKDTTTIKDHEILKANQEQFCSSPWSDGGPIVSTNWKALDTEWHFSWPNDWELTIASEEVIALLQIFLVKLAQVETCILPGKVFITTSLIDSRTMKLHRGNSNSDSLWTLEIPNAAPDGDPYWNKYYPQLLGCIVTILYDISALPEKDLQYILSDEWISSILEHGFFGETYRRVLKFWLTEDLFDLYQRNQADTKTNTWTNIEPCMSTHLQSQCKLASCVPESELVESVQNRYSRSIPPLKLTIERLTHDQNFKDAYSKLKDKGWKDWHFLLSLINIVLNERHDIFKIFGGDRCRGEKFLEQFWQTPESADALPIPSEKFSEEQLVVNLESSMMSTLDSYGFAIRQNTPNFQAISVFLGKHLSYWTIDIKHEPIFTFE